MRGPYGFEMNENCQTCKLRKSGYFCQLQGAALKNFDAAKASSVYPEGAVLFIEKQEARGVFVLCEGQVKLSISSAEGKTLILRIAKPGEVLGLHAVVSGQPYQASAETLESCQVNFVRQNDFLTFLRQHSEASIVAAQQLSGSYQAACEQIRSLGLTHSASEKLARFLLESSAKGQETRQGIRVRLTMTHEEIGQVIGTSRETVTRTLSEFKQKQLVALNGSMLVIQNRAALESFVSV